MKLNKLIVTFLALAASFTAANAAVTVAFNAPFAGGLSSGFTTTAGVAGTNGLKWGIIVDTTGNGLLSTYDQVALVQGTSVSLTTNGGTATGDRLIFAANLTSDSSQGGQALESDFATPGGNGGVDGLSFALAANGIAVGQAFSIVWFDSSTNKAGSLSNAQFLVPADGQTVTYDAPFVGVDPVRQASNISFVPEPSSLLLGALGVFGLIRRRR
ncbi:PEP-CTERM sorting domain-containing protein [Haloferula sp. BvORR071]|uniref:PEP-CTERM sorting domain-containing protein n=1 Tax=Haloferula sp. BvORR071 TaxID=1396141 RepID=UPI0005589511|nr:PEP-CTERM sorting domain-containing protein [Haloferula sp. BvORR071]